MNETDPIKRFLDDNYAEPERLVSLLHASGLIDEDRRGAVFHALVDVANGMQKIYGAIIPGMLRLEESDAEALRDAFFDLRFQFQHIDYHIHDAALDEL